MSQPIKTRQKKIFDGTVQYVLLRACTSSVLYKLHLIICVIILEYSK